MTSLGNHTKVAAQPEEYETQPDFPANALLHFNTLDNNEHKKAPDINLEPLNENNIGDLSEAAPLPVATQPLKNSSPNQPQSHTKR